MTAKPHTQSGNAFIIILVAVFLFGALMFTFGRSAEKGTGNLTKQQAKIAAQEILNYAQAVEGAVDRVRRNGCSESEISFENSITSTDYTNTNAPSDKRCHIFEPEGGKISYSPPDERWFNGFNEWFFNSRSMITNIGKTCNNNSCPELKIHTRISQNNLCEAINKLINNDIITTPIDSDYGYRTSDGSFSPSPVNISDEPTSIILSGKNSACFYATADDKKFFYYVLLAR